METDEPKTCPRFRRPNRNTIPSLALLFAVAIQTGCLGTTVWAQSFDKPLTEMTTRDWSAEVVADGLDYPWDLDLIGSSVIFTEAAGTVAMVADSKLTRRTLETSAPIAREGGGGLLGMAVPADFDTTQLAYFYHTYRGDSGLTNKVIEARLEGNAWRETRTLVDNIPGHRLYNGGRIAFGPDGYLYVTTGWSQNPDLPQDLDSLAGKILRMERDGSRPADNPFPASLVYSYGHRNPQGLAWNARGELFIAEHGQSAHDEINRIEVGGNYGWPIVSGDQRRDGMIMPFAQSGSDTWAPSGVAFMGNTLLVSALQSRALLAMNETGGPLREVFSSNERLRDVIVAPDGIYVITTNRSPRATGPSQDRLLRLTSRQ